MECTTHLNLFGVRADMIVVSAIPSVPPLLLGGKDPLGLAIPDTSLGQQSDGWIAMFRGLGSAVLCCL